MPSTAIQDKERQEPKLVIVTEDAIPVVEKTSKVDEIRSDEVQEILTRIPSWTIRWGITLIFGLIVMLLVFSWFVKYPDIITSPMVLSTENPPVRLVSKVSGKIIGLKQNNGALVIAGQRLGLVESPISNEELVFLKSYLEDAHLLLKDSTHVISVRSSDYAFGELQITFNQLSKACFEYQKLQQNTNEIMKMETLSSKIKSFQKVQVITKRQRNIVKSELKNMKYVYDENLILYNNGTISKMELFREESRYRQKQMEVESLNKSIAEIEINLNNFRQELSDLEFNYSDKIKGLKNDITLNLNSIQSGIENWGLNYEITAPVNGRLVYLSNWKNNEYVTAATPMFAVIPVNEEYVANLKIPSNGYGKIKVGQKVRLSLNGFPPAEFGYLEGTVSYLNEIPTKGEYLAQVTLPNGMESSYQITLEFSPEMDGVADVITDDLRVLERLFIQFNKLTERRMDVN